MIGRPAPALTYGTLARCDARALARVHRRGFPGFFLAELGEPFLRQLYLGYAADPTAITAVARADGRPVGAVLGTSAPAGFYGRLLRRRGPAFALAGARAALRDPRVLPRLVGAVRYRGDAPATPDAPTPPPSPTPATSPASQASQDSPAASNSPAPSPAGAGVGEDTSPALLASIVVDPDWAGRGIGAELARTWRRRAAARGVRRAYLLTDARDNAAVHSFYESLGWVVLDEFTTPHGRLMTRYGTDL